MTEQPVRSVCWPDDPDYLDGKTEIELPSRRYTQVFWDADIIDLDDKNKADTILGTEQAFQVRFRVEMRGRLWRCITGDWLFDVGFKPIGPGRGFYLSSLLPGNPGFEVKDWRGCDSAVHRAVCRRASGHDQAQGRPGHRGLRGGGQGRTALLRRPRRGRRLRGTRGVRVLQGRLSPYPPPTRPGAGGAGPRAAAGTRGGGERQCPATRSTPFPASRRSTGARWPASWESPAFRPWRTVISALSTTPWRVSGHVRHPSSWRHGRTRPAAGSVTRRTAGPHGTPLRHSRSSLLSARSMAGGNAGSKRSRRRWSPPRNHGSGQPGTAGHCATGCSASSACQKTKRTRLARPRRRGARCRGARRGKRCARTSRAAYQRRHDHRGRPRPGADQRRPSRHGPARRSTAPCPPALHRARSASGPAVAGGRMVPPPGRARLEPAGTGDRSRLG